jgi:uncharacterized protein (TIGR02001 family)
MRNLHVLAAIGLLSASAAVHAEISSTWTLTSDYDFRGITQTDEDPALQASFDYSNESGWYVGAWASNVDFPGYDGSVELDLYTGFSGGEEDGLGWDVGLVWYTYPGSDSSDTEDKIADFPEIYGGITYGIWSGKLWYSNDFGGTDDSSIYLDGGVDIPLPRNLSLAIHAGYSDGDGIKASYGVSNYFDYSVGIGYTVNNFNLSLKYVDTDIDDADTDRVIFTVSTTLPW